ncbi:MAG TPA: helix-turn-helix transcriptional regulator [Bacteriovoracaceae bacterium]|nr:helix-turn-helix transcriptional regulator [Bacteriovoracaceae bacterium]
MTKEALALRQLRILKGLSVRKAADLLNVSHTLVNHLEIGRANISETYVQNFLKALGYSSDDWHIAVMGKKKSGNLTKSKITEDCLNRIEALPEEKLRLIQSILANL